MEGFNALNSNMVSRNRREGINSTSVFWTCDSSDEQVSLRFTGRYSWCYSEHILWINQKQQYICLFLMQQRYTQKLATTVYFHF